MQAYVSPKNTRDRKMRSGEATTHRMNLLGPRMSNDGYWMNFDVGVVDWIINERNR
jgi:hypothetical protein